MRDALPDQPRRAARLPRLTKRSEFLAAAAGRRFHTARMTVQCIARSRPAVVAIAAGPRFGLTVTKKVGGAVERNRIRRRLRAALQMIEASWPPADIDVVVIARREALSAPFPTLATDLQRALASCTKLSDAREPTRPASPTDRP